eukprot:Em0001g2006a
MPPGCYVQKEAEFAEHACKSGFTMIAAAVDKKPADVLPKLMYGQDQPNRPDIAVVALQLFMPTLFLSLLLLALMMFLHASAATTVPAGTSTVPAAITADDPATVPAAISGDATTADVPGTDPGATNFADVPGTDPGATTFDVPRPGALREKLVRELFMNMKDHEIACSASVDTS